MRGLTVPSDAADRRRAAALAAELKSESLKMVTYAESERMAERLAALLLDEIGSVSAWRFRAVPRGGFIVLGMLAYLLDLRSEQLHTSDDHGAGTVIVDDAVLTGYRMRENLRLAAGPKVVAVLAASSEVSAALRSEPGVTAVCSAVALRPPNSDSHSARIGERSIGQVDNREVPEPAPQAVAFPWAEPDYVLATDEGVERGWQLRSPEDCLEHRGTLGRPSHDRLARQLRFADVAHARFDDHCLVYIKESELVVRLDERGTELWGALGSLGSVSETVKHLPARTGLPREDLEPLVEAFAERCLAAGLLLPCPERADGRGFGTSGLTG